MSLNVLIIPEDCRKDQYVLEPVVSRMMQEVGKPRAKVRVCQDPVLRGISQALRWERIEEIIGMYPMVQLFLLIVDRDGIPTRRLALDRLEQQAESVLGQDRKLLGENAWQEVEVWALAGQELPREWNWHQIRKEEHPKETYFEVFAAQRKLDHEPGAGRTSMGREAASNYSRVRSRCPEDIQALETRLSTWLQTLS